MIEEWAIVNDNGEIVKRDFETEEDAISYRDSIKEFEDFYIAYLD